jgi:hypothetical protein
VDEPAGDYRCDVSALYLALVFHCSMTFRIPFFQRTTTKENRVKEALDAVNIPDLTPEEMGAIAEAGSKIHKRHYMRHVYGE